MISSVNKLVLFGAGKIGRSFIAQVFSRSGYKVVLVDINRNLIDLLNTHQQYKVVIKRTEGDEIIPVENVSGIHLDEVDKVISELIDAPVVALSVGQQGIPAALPLLAKALVVRRHKHGDWPLDIIIAENMRDADRFIQKELRLLLPGEYPLDELVGLVETSIGKMVPIMLQKDIDEDPLQVFAEPYNSLIVAKGGFKNAIPRVRDLAPKENIKAWVDRKLFIHNLGHAAAAYLGFIRNPDFVYIHQALGDPEVLDATRQTMLQSATVLMQKYPGEFSLNDMTGHIDDLLFRFQNRALGDTIFRVGCDLFRKLGPEDRVAGAIQSALQLNLPYTEMLKVLVSGCYFRASDENGNMFNEDVKFVNLFQNNIKSVLSKVCGFNEITHGLLFQEAEKINAELLC